MADLPSLRANMVTIVFKSKIVKCGVGKLMDFAEGLSKHGEGLLPRG